MQTVKSLDAIPAVLKQIDTWCCWNYENNTKVPYQPSGQKARVNDYRTFAPFRHCADKPYHGLGFIFSEYSNVIGIDLDGHVDQDLIELLDSYTELSPSRNGCHIIACVSSDLPHGYRSSTSKMEMYDNGRFFTMTGNVIHDAPIRNIDEHMPYLLETFFPRVAKDRQTRNYESSDVDLSSLDLDDQELLKRLWKSKDGAANKMRYYGEYLDDIDGRSDPSLTRFIIIKMLWKATEDFERVLRLLWASGLDKSKWEDDRKGSPFIEYDAANIIRNHFNRDVYSDLQANA